jgi:hypothetical protein
MVRSPFDKKTLRLALFFAETVSVSHCSDASPQLPAPVHDKMA